MGAKQAKGEACELIVAVSGGVMTEAAAVIAADDLVHWLSGLRRRFRYLPQALVLAVPDPLAGLLRSAIADSGGELREIDLSAAFDTAQRAAGAKADMADVICRFSHILVSVSENGSGDPLTGRWVSHGRKWCEPSAVFEAELELSEPVIGPVFEINIDDAIVSARSGLKPGKVKPRHRTVTERSDDCDFLLGATARSQALQEFNRLNRDLARASEAQVSDAGATLLPDRAGDGTGELAGEGLATSLKLYGAAEWFAVKTHNQLLRPMHVLVAASLPVSIGLYEILTKLGEESWRMGVFFYLLAFLAALGVVGYVRAFSSQERAQDARLFAEIVRISVWWRLAGVRSHLEPTLTWCLPRRPIGVVLAARALDLRTQVHAQATRDETEFVRREWVGPLAAELADRDLTHRHTQTVWYRLAADKQMKAARRLSQVQMALLVIATTVAAIAIGADVLVADPAMIRDYVVPMAVSVLPAAAGAVAILRERRAHVALAENYLRMARVAERASARLANAAGAEGLALRRLILEQFGQAAIAEGADWLIVNRQRPLGPT